jgi:hypothetical protein
MITSTFCSIAMNASATIGASACRAKWRMRVAGPPPAAAGVRRARSAASTAAVPAIASGVPR